MTGHYAAARNHSRDGATEAAAGTARTRRATSWPGPGLPAQAPAEAAGRRVRARARPRRPRTRARDRSPSARASDAVARSRWSRSTSRTRRPRGWVEQVRGERERVLLGRRRATSRTALRRPSTRRPGPTRAAGCRGGPSSPRDSRRTAAGGTRRAAPPDQLASRAAGCTDGQAPPAVPVGQRGREAPVLGALAAPAPRRPARTCRPPRRAHRGRPCG